MNEKFFLYKKKKQKELLSFFYWKILENNSIFWEFFLNKKFNTKKRNLFHIFFDGIEIPKIFIPSFYTFFKKIEKNKKIKKFYDLFLNFLKRIKSKSENKIISLNFRSREGYTFQLKTRSKLNKEYQYFIKNIENFFTNKKNFPLKKKPVFKILNSGIEQCIPIPNYRIEFRIQKNTVPNLSFFLKHINRKNIFHVLVRFDLFPKTFRKNSLSVVDSNSPSFQSLLNSI